MENISAPDYLDPQIPRGLKRIHIPVIEASEANIKGYGVLVDDPDKFDIEIVRWPAKGWRPVDPDSGNEGGVTSGTFISEWKGDVLYGSNEAVGGEYIIGYNCEPADADEEHERAPERILLWHCNYHPDGGQLFFPMDKKPFVVPVALPGDDIKPEDFVCFRFDGTKGFYIHPDIWHEGVFSLEGRHDFMDKQGAVHARVSVNFAREFDCLLEIVLK